MNSKLGSLTAQSKKKPVMKYQNPVESFKDSGSISPKNPSRNLAKPQVIDQGASAGGESFNFEEFLRLKEKKIRSQEKNRFEIIKREEKVIFSREQQRVKTQLESIQNQIKGLIKEQAGVVEEIEKASFEAVVNPGVYHQNFFERLQELLIIARKKLCESKTWLQIFNSRISKKNYYRHHFKKSGSQFFLSGERSVATQTG